MKLQFKLPCGKDELFVEGAFDNSVGTGIVVNGVKTTDNTINVTAGRLLAAEIIDGGKAALLTIEVGE